MNEIKTIYVVRFNPLPSFGAPYIWVQGGFWETEELAQCMADRENEGTSAQYGFADVVAIKAGK